MASDSLWDVELDDTDPLEGLVNPDWKPDPVRLKARLERCRQRAIEREETLRRIRSRPVNWDGVVY